MQPTEIIADFLKRKGWDVEVQDELITMDYQTEASIGTLALAIAQQTPYLITRFDLTLDIFVHEDSLAEVMMGLNLINQQFSVGCMYLDLVEMEDEAAEDDISEPDLLFLLGARGSTVLEGMEDHHLELLQHALEVFVEEVSEAITNDMGNMPKTMQA
ncbi:hypothetical protein [Deinococcus cellulosilyticus]|uniref:Uncharacterized protein n=1 Tax=Deinococcus cellulosilyticus (strain DSM 18568 / NBRC 106333 / KACC 11606 / 5516J-15) TaxID=1223518 RepID=A0A511N805_DEIC1|nr:hypothetical protein [Deinococcus cellulosilyticus]GEM48969.1 hypothetical protein DC3_46040 [Deinococcus cellulosilyticus NBRC 106333 = KACC 11606]